MKEETTTLVSSTLSTLLLSVEEAAQAKMLKMYTWLCFLTNSMQKVVVERKGHEGIGQLSEPTFNEASDGVDGVVIQQSLHRI